MRHIALHGERQLLRRHLKALVGVGVVSHHRLREQLVESGQQHLRAYLYAGLMSVAHRGVYREILHERLESTRMTVERLYRGRASAILNGERHLAHRHTIVGKVLALQQPRAQLLDEQRVALVGKQQVTRHTQVGTCCHQAVNGLLVATQSLVGNSL